jgi:hypothetical protein
VKSKHDINYISPADLSGCIAYWDFNEYIDLNSGFLKNITNFSTEYSNFQQRGNRPVDISLQNGSVLWLKFNLASGAAQDSCGVLNNQFDKDLNDIYASGWDGFIFDLYLSGNTYAISASNTDFITYLGSDLRVGGFTNSAASWAHNRNQLPTTGYLNPASMFQFMQAKTNNPNEWIGSYADEIAFIFEASGLTGSAIIGIGDLKAYKSPTAYDKVNGLPFKSLNVVSCDGSNGRGLDFDSGIGTCILSGEILKNITNQWTVSYWLQTKNAGGLVIAGGSSGVYETIRMDNGATSCNVQLSSGTSYRESIQNLYYRADLGSPDFDLYQHNAFTYKNGSLNYYFNGGLRDTRTTTFQAVNPNGFYVLGRRGYFSESKSYFWLDDLAFFDRELNIDEIGSLARFSRIKPITIIAKEET